jgi:hypothetical protein
MKKILSILSLMAVTTFLHAQGTVAFNNLVANVTTNSAISHFAGGTETGGTGGKTATTAGLFIYQLFVQTYTGSLSASATNPTAGGWSVAFVDGTSTPITGTNRTAAGAIVGLGGNSGAAISGLALPTASNYSTAGRDYFMFAGWSANLGSTWSDVSGKLASGFDGNTIANAFFGVSIIGNSYAGGAFSLQAPSLFVTAAASTPVGFGTGVVLYTVPVPEPSTFVLAGLGGLSLLMLRRRK